MRERLPLAFYGLALRAYRITLAACRSFRLAHCALIPASLLAAFRIFARRLQLVAYCALTFPQTGLVLTAWLLSPCLLSLAAYNLSFRKRKGHEQQQIWWRAVVARGTVANAKARGGCEKLGKAAPV